MSIKMLNIKEKIPFLRDAIKKLYVKNSEVFNLTPIPIINNFLLILFSYMLWSLISNQIVNSSFITAHILSWDSYVYMCGVSLFLNGQDPYDYIVLRDCLPDNWNFYFNITIYSKRS